MFDDQEQQQQQDPLSMMLAMQQGQAAPPVQDPIGLSQPQQNPDTRMQKLSGLLGNFLYAVGQGMSASAQYPGARGTRAGMGASLTAPFELQQQRQKMALEAAQAQRQMQWGQSAYENAITNRLKSSLMIDVPDPNDPTQTIKIPLGAVGAYQQQVARNAGNLNVQGSRNAGNLAVQGERNAGQFGVWNIRSAIEQARNNALQKRTETQNAGNLAVQQSRNEGNLAVASKNAASRESVAKIYSGMSFMDGPLAQAIMDGVNNGTMKLSDIPSRMPGLKFLAAANKDTVELDPTAKGVVDNTAPVLDQINRILAVLEPYKNDNTPAKMAGARLKYAGGMVSYDDLGKIISEMELARVAGSARVIRGASRAASVLEQAAIHLPNTWKTSPALAYNQLSTVKANLTDILNAATIGGNVSGFTKEDLEALRQGIVPERRGAGTTKSNQQQQAAPQPAGKTKAPSRWDAIKGNNGG